MTKTLAIVGAGPKAAALVARATVLRDLGVKTVPELLVFERRAVGSAWSGDAGFSSGFLTLCSPGEKDVGFPYFDLFAPTSERLLGRIIPPIAPAIYARFSWSAYLVATGGFSEWVDRGRDHPTHKKWADYLAWVFLEARHRIIPNQVVRVTPRTKGGWYIEHTNPDGETNTTYADGVVLTGTGRAKPMSGLHPAIPTGHVFDAATFWDHRTAIAAMKDVAVTGGGGAAGAIMAWLCEELAEQPGAIIQSISSMGTLFPRGDGYSERRWFSDPTEWRKLSLADRRKLLERTEVAVISERNKSLIDRARNVTHVQGRATGAVWKGGRLEIGLSYDGSALPPIEAACLVNAIGFDPWSVLGLVNVGAARSILSTWKEARRNKLAEDMLPDLSFPARSRIPAGLHVPALAALAHGPGMATLGSLGLLASAILDGYL